MPDLRARRVSAEGRAVEYYRDELFEFGLAEFIGNLFCLRSVRVYPLVFAEVTVAGFGMKRFFNTLFVVMVLGVAAWGIYAIAAQETFRPTTLRSRHIHPAGWVYGPEAVRLGIMWIVVSAFMAAEFWLPERIMTRPMRIVMGLVLVALVAWLTISMR